MSVYAYALAGYSLPYVPEDMRPVASHVISSAALILLGLVNYRRRRAGGEVRKRVQRRKACGPRASSSSSGLFASGLDWGRLEPAEWASPSAIVASGDDRLSRLRGLRTHRQRVGQHRRSEADVADRLPRLRRSSRSSSTLWPSSWASAICLFPPLSPPRTSRSPPRPKASSDRSASPSWPSARFSRRPRRSTRTISAPPSFPPQLATINEMPSAFHRSLHGKSVISLVVIGVLALLAVNFVVDRSDVVCDQRWFPSRLRRAQRRRRSAWRTRPAPTASSPPSRRFLCIVALAITIWEFVSVPSTVSQAVAIAAIVVASIVDRMGLPIARPGPDAVEGREVMRSCCEALPCPRKDPPRNRHFVEAGFRTIQAALPLAD